MLMAIPLYGTPKFIRSDNGPEFIADKFKKWLEQKYVGTLYIESATLLLLTFGAVMMRKRT